MGTFLWGSHNAQLSINWMKIKIGGVSMMKLKKFRVTNFRSVEDSGWIDADDVTALIGTNESGKTNIILPLWKLNPGDIYDPAYAPTFLKANQSKLGFLNGYSIAWTQKINDDTKTVDLFIFFRGPESRTQ